MCMVLLLTVGIANSSLYTGGLRMGFVYIGVLPRPHTLFEDVKVRPVTIDA